MTGIPAIELIDVQADLAGTPVLRGISFAAHRGRITWDAAIHEWSSMPRSRERI